MVKTQVCGQDLETGTGFVIQHQGKAFLVTNWHIVSGINPETGAIRSGTPAVPDEIQILHNSPRGLAHWEWRSERLFEDGSPLWHEHPQHGRNVDLVLLPLTQLNDVKLFPYSIDAPSGSSDFLIGPAEVVSVIGFPFGLSGGGGLAIWATGFVATEPDIDYNDLPLFLIDCRARQGQSGSAVLAYRGYGAICRMRDGKNSIQIGDASRLMGVYSGRINEESDLGKVWKVRAIHEIFAAVPV